MVDAARIAFVPTRWQRTLVLAITIILAFDLSSCLFLILIQRVPPTVLLAISAEALILGGGTLWLLARRAGGFVALGVTPRGWARAAAIGCVVMFALIRVLTHASLQGSHGLAALALLEIIALPIVATVARRFLPQRLLDVLEGELAFYAATWRLLRQRPIALDSESFTATRTSQLRHVALGLTVASLFEAPALHLLLHHFGVSFIVQSSIGMLHLSALAWLLGDCRLMTESGHRLGPHALTIALGQRWRGEVAYTDIVAARRITTTIRKRAVTPLERPNVELTLRAPIVLTSYFGIRRTLPSLRLYLDDPDGFLALLHPRLS